MKGQRLDALRAEVLREEASVQLASMNPAPYQLNRVNRRAVFTFDAGREIYELVDPDGRRWVMQTWSQTVDPALSLSDLAGLASRLNLPPGWSYQVRTPDSPLRVDTTAQDACVTQDDLANSYSFAGVNADVRGRQHRWMTADCLP